MLQISYDEVFVCFFFVFVFVYRDGISLLSLNDTI